MPTLMSLVEVPSTWQLCCWWLNAAELLQPPSRRPLLPPSLPSPSPDHPTNYLLRQQTMSSRNKMRYGAMRKVTANKFCFLCNLIIHSFSGMPQLHQKAQLRCGRLLYALPDSLTTFFLRFPIWKVGINLSWKDVLSWEEQLLGSDQCQCLATTIMQAKQIVVTE